MNKTKRKIRFSGLLVSAAMLFSGCSIVPEFPEDNVTIFSNDGRYQLKAPLGWEKMNDAVMNNQLFAIKYPKRNNTFCVYIEDHTLYNVYSFDKYCDKMIKEWFCESLTLSYPETYNEEIALGQTVRWYEGHDQSYEGTNTDYFCCFAEYGEKETEKTYFIAYGFSPNLNSKVKEEYLDMIDSIETAKYE